MIVMGILSVVVGIIKGLLKTAVKIGFVILMVGILFYYFTA